MGKKKRCTCGRKAREFRAWKAWPWGRDAHCHACGRKIKSADARPAPIVVDNLVPNFDELQKEINRVTHLYAPRKEVPPVQLPPLCTVCHGQRARSNSTTVCEECAEYLAKSPDALIDVLESLGYTVGSVNDEDDYKGADHADSRD